MSNFNRIMAKEMAKIGGKTKIVPGKGMGFISPDIEWIKWLSYEPEFESKRIEYLNSKKISELSYEELEEALSYSRNKILTELFKMYSVNECSEKDYMKVYDYMCNESIEKLMLKKLTFEELQYAEQEITRLIGVPKEQLIAKINEEQKPEKYEQLSMIDAYILHKISDINYVRSMAILDRKIYAQLEQNDVMRQRSLDYTKNRRNK